MPVSCCDFRNAADRQFTSDKAAKELRAYQKGQVGPTTRLLHDGVIELGLNNGSLLDIGGGVGALTFELLERGMDAAVVADASIAYVRAAVEEAIRRKRSRSVRVVYGDVFEVSKDLPAADLVTLDRVVCCYPSYQPLLEEATRHAERAIALSYPRDRWFVRVAMWVENARRARKSGFRTFVHSPASIQEVIEQAGFQLARRRSTAMWTADIFVRRC
jgi:magnesium-protoporphyrin O-methyltransferase